MNDAQFRFHSIVGRPPARFTVEEVGWQLNFQPYEVLALTALGMLEPVGDPPAPNSTRMYFAQDILELSANRSWVKKATNAMYRYRQKKNHTDREDDESSNGSRHNLVRRSVG